MSKLSICCKAEMQEENDQCINCGADGNPSKKWILKDSSSGSFFKQWTGIGPQSTDKEEEAMIFESKEEAMQSQAFTFALMDYNPKQKKE